MTTYLRFNSATEAATALTSIGFVMSDYGDHCTKGLGWGTIFSIPDEIGTFVNLYDCACPDELVQYQVPTPKTPFSTRW